MRIKLFDYYESLDIRISMISCIVLINYRNSTKIVSGEYFSSLECNALFIH